MEGYRYRTDPKTKTKLTFLKGTNVIQRNTRIISNILCKLLILLHACRNKLNV